jgi:hypothetical protein
MTYWHLCNEQPLTTLPRYELLCEMLPPLSIILAVTQTLLIIGKMLFWHGVRFKNATPGTTVAA